MHKRIWPLLLILAFMAAPPIAMANELHLPNLGGDEGALSLQQEKDIGAEFMQQARASLPLMDDPEVNAYIRDMGYRLLAQMDSPFKHTRFFIVENPDINAFAVPGGYVGINTGLILAAKTDSQLAGVLAHELTHIVQRHLSRSIEENRRFQWPTLAAMLAGILLSASSGQAGQAALSASMAYGTQQHLHFSREFEREADRLGIRAMAAAGYNPNGMWEFFERLQNWSRIQSGNPQEFLSTHPLTVNRIADARNRAEQLDPKASPDKASPDFLRVQTRLRALTEANREAEPYFAALSRRPDPRQRELGQYGLGLVLARKGQYPEALAQLSALSRAHPDVLPYQTAWAQTLMQAGDPAQGLKLYERIHDTHPDSVLVKESLARALLANGRSDLAASMFRSLVFQHPREPRFQKDLAEALSKAGDQTDAHRALAEYYYGLGAVPNAIDQLEIAKALSLKDYRTRAAIKARLAEMKAADKDRKDRISQLK